MNLITFTISALSLLVSTAYADMYIEDRVACKAKVERSDSLKPKFSDLSRLREDNLAIYYGANLEGFDFEIASFKTIFFFKPTIRTSTNEVSGHGAVATDGIVKLRWSENRPNAVKVTADLRCCYNCTFSDWP